MEVTSLLLWILFLQMTLTLPGVYLETSEKPYCVRKSEDNLTDRVHNADVIISGTVIEESDRSSKHREKVEPVGGNSGKPEKANSQSGSRSVALVKVWRVIKGSLMEIDNISSAPGDLLSNMRTQNDFGDSDEMQYPIVKLYGLRNDMICGSYVSTLDTRIFFLRKFRDVRDLPKTFSKSVKKNTSVEKQEDIGIATSAPSSPSEIEQEVVSKSTPSKNKSKRKSKGKREKKKKKKRTGRRKNKKNKLVSKRIPIKKRKPSAKKNRMKRMSESISSVWLEIFQNARSKRATMIIKNSPKISHEKRSVDQQTPRSVLVLNAMPARITLQNLNMVEKLSKTD